MKEEPKFDPKKALKHEAKGDKLVRKGKYRDAVIEYKKSEAFNPQRPEIYDKLIEAHSQHEHEWDEEDFSDSMSWTMRRQELQNPQLRLVNETFSVEYREVHRLLQGLMAAVGEEQENDFIEKILDYGEKASLPTLHFLLSIKGLAGQGFENSDAPPPPL